MNVEEVPRGFAGRSHGVGTTKLTPQAEAAVEQIFEESTDGEILDFLQAIAGPRFVEELELILAEDPEAPARHADGKGSLRGILTNHPELRSR